MKISKILLAVAMAKKGYNFLELVDVANVSRTTLSCINNGKTCSAKTVCKIAKALDVKPEELLEQN